MILALDPSTAAIGYCYGEPGRGSADLTFGSCVLKGVSATARVRRGLDDLNRLIAACGSALELVVAEVPNTNRHTNRNRVLPMGQHGSFVMGMVAGAILARCAALSLPLHFWDAVDLRQQLLSGSPQVGKHEAQWYVQHVMGLDLPLGTRGDIDHDACDAIALWAVARDNFLRETRTQERVVVG